MFVRWVVVVAQWQSACALYKWSWVQFSVATKHFLNSVLFKNPVKERIHLCYLPKLKGYWLLCYSLTRNRPTKFLFFQRFLLFIEFLFSSYLSLHNFFFSLLLMYSLSFTGFLNTELRIFGCHWVFSIPGGTQIILILYCLKSLWKRENTSNE